MFKVNDILELTTLGKLIAPLACLPDIIKIQAVTDLAYEYVYIENGKVHNRLTSIFALEKEYQIKG